jgi:hypothetical protein
MTTIHWLIGGGIAYIVLDFVLGMTLGRCVLPGLKCSACRGGHK